MKSGHVPGARAAAGAGGGLGLGPHAHLPRSCLFRGPEEKHDAAEIVQAQAVGPAFDSNLPVGSRL